MDAAGLDPTVDTSDRRAIEKARFKYAAGCLHASKETGLPGHERAGYLAAWRTARDEAAGPGAPTPLFAMSHRRLGVATERAFPSDASNTVASSASKGRPHRSLPRGGDSATEAREGLMQQLPIMRGLEGGLGERDDNTGEALLNDVYDLISKRLPRLPLTDPARPILAALSPMLAQSLGRPLVAEVQAAPLPRGSAGA